MLVERLRQVGFWRGGLVRHGHQEWMHFSVTGDGITVLLNVSVADDERPAARPGAQRGRVLFLVQGGSGWDGASLESDDVAPRLGDVGVRIGSCLVETTEDAIEVTGAIAERGTTFALRFRPTSEPSVANNVELGATSAPVHWVVVPSLDASGALTIGGRTHVFERAPAYHDHNWGYYRQRGFAWQWGHASSEATSVVFARLTNVERTSVAMQCLLLWEDGRPLRLFRERDVSVEEEGRLRTEPLTIPRRARLLAGPRALDIPARLRLRGEADGDAVVCTFEADDVVRIALPDDATLETTFIHEVVGRLRMSGTVRGRPVHFEGRSVFELLGRTR